MHRRRLAVSVLLTLLTARSAAATPILSIEPSNITVNSGDIFSVDVAIANVSDLYGFQFDIGFNQQVLQVNDIAIGTFLLTGGPTSVITSARRHKRA